MTLAYECRKILRITFLTSSPALCLIYFFTIISSLPGLRGSPLPDINTSDARSVPPVAVTDISSRGLRYKSGDAPYVRKMPMTPDKAQ